MVVVRMPEADREPVEREGGAAVLGVKPRRRLDERAALGGAGDGTIVVYRAMVFGRPPPAQRQSRAGGRARRGAALMQLFLYGTLLDPRRLAARAGNPALPLRAAPAVLRGWRRVAAAGARYPTLARDPKGEVAGAVLAVPAAAVARLQAYEGPEYRLVRMRVCARAAGRPVAAYAWIAPASRRPWRP
jgi:gamma-glutamylcyclotransferase (GGCT)/AIG2-like uncharacterized protein YtfP